MATYHSYKRQNSNKTYWEYRIYYKDPITNKFREKSKKGFTSKAECKKAAEEMERKLAEGVFETDETLKQYLKNWLEEHRKDVVAKNTYQMDEYSIQNHILPYFKNILLKNVTPTLYQRFLNNMYSKGYSRRTIEIAHTTMNNAMKKAVTQGKIQKNPCVGSTIKGKKKEQEIKFIDSDLLSDFYKAAYEYGYIYWIFFKVLIETGMRKGEAAALQWTDINLKERTIDINKSLDFEEAPKNKDKMFGDVKTYHSKRVIRISKSLADDLTFHIKYQNQNKLALQERYHHDLNLVLCRNDGNYMPKSTLFNAFERILKRAGISRLPIHSLRHTHAVLSLEAGVEMKELQERLGHGSYKITADVYSHVSRKMEDRAIEKFENYMEKIFE